MALKIPAVLGVTTVVLAVSTTFAGVATASGDRPAMVFSSGTEAVNHAASDACYVQLGGDSGTATNSQKLKHRSEFNDRAADDFSLSEPCSVESLDVAGTYFGPDRLINASVVLYRDDGGTPGTIVARSTVPADKVTDNSGSLHVPLASPVALEPGTYWLGFRVRMPALPDGGGWFWFTNQPQSGNPAVWKNRGDGFGLGCKVYHPLADCFRQGNPLDFAFAVNEGR